MKSLIATAERRLEMPSRTMLRAAFIPVWAGNPYHAELMRVLKELGVTFTSSHQLKDVSRCHNAGTERVNLVHLHILPYLHWTPVELARYVFFYGRLLRLQRSGVKVVWTVHDLDNHDSGCKRIEGRMSRVMARRADALIAHGPSAKALIVERWGCNPSKVKVIPHGNYFEAYPNDTTAKLARNALGLNADDFVFLFLGLIRPYKGVTDLISAFRSIDRPSVRLLIAGCPVDGKIALEVATAARSDFRIVYRPGFVPDDEVQTHMAAADVVVLPYRKILTSGAAILAMSFGKPCIAPRDGCVADALDESGAVFFNPRDEDGLGDALRAILSRRETLAAMGQHNRERAACWDWRSIGQATAQVYEECLWPTVRTALKP